MRNPLNKRLLRDLKEDFGKYLVLFILLVFSISLMSGYLVAGESMIRAYDESFDKYNIENGNFTVNKKMNVAEINAAEQYGIKIYEQFYKSFDTDDGKELRAFKNRKEVNQICIMSGRLPEKSGEMALDRMFAENNGISLNDIIHTETGDYIITGLAAFSDYSALFQNDSDIMFDAVNFSVCIVSDEEFDAYDSYTCNYAFKYVKEPENDAEEKTVSEQLMKDINSEVRLSSFIPRYRNQAIRFTGGDLSSDKEMMQVLLYMIIVIIAFVFAVTISGTVQKEMGVIGTLLASGYTRNELLVHYMTMPLIITVISAVIGNILGYTVMKDLCVNLYYASYSLPSYKTIWSLSAFIRTTLIPLVMTTLINFFIIYRSLKTPVINFLRKQTGSSGNKHVLHLNRHIPFFTRYRIRVILQNLGSYGILLAGIIFANLLLLFSLDLPVLLDSFQDEMETNPLAPYITMLKLPDSLSFEDHKLEAAVELISFMNEAETDNKTAEKFSAYSLSTVSDPSADYEGEDITIYGIADDSGYIDMETDNHNICVSKAYADKFDLKPGDTVILKEKYEDKYYSFEIDGTVDYLGSLCLFMPLDDLNEVFGLGKGTFAGYFSETEIDDIDDKYIGSVVDVNALTRVSRQLKVSMGGMMDFVAVFGVVIYVVLIYVLSKVIIDKNIQSISMSKIMGYSNGEISRLYIITTSIVFLLMLVGSLPVECKALIWIFKEMMMSKMKGWIPLTISADVLVKLVGLALASYILIGVLEMRRIASIPMDQALKNTE